MTFKRWIPTFLAFPLGGLLAYETVGSVTGVGTAAAAGLLAGAVIGVGQWLALRDRVDARWAAVTAAAMTAGSAVAAVATGAGTETGELVVAGPSPARRSGRRRAVLLRSGAMGGRDGRELGRRVADLRGRARPAGRRGLRRVRLERALVATIPTGLALRRTAAAEKVRML